jgi:hypothetical protein
MKRRSIVPGREYVMVNQRPFVLMETLDDPLTIPVAPEPLLRMDPNYSSGGGGDNDRGDGRRPRCGVCLFTILVGAIIVVVNVIVGVVSGWGH